MLSFECDYNVGAHPILLQRLVDTNLVRQSGYGADEYTASAKEKIRDACGDPTADVFFLAGGTQTNQIVIDTCLSPVEGVISADTGHVNAHEAGAVEFTGHKIIALPNEHGKLRAGDVDACIRTVVTDENADHLVRPGMVYVSHPTEYGTLYTKAELAALSDVCRKHGIKLFLDGARLGYGLESAGTDVTLRDVAELCDVFYIGGTKVGALCGEAVVFPRGGAPRYFFTAVKQHGALLAKGRLIGVQFDALFTDGLYFEISRRAIRAADRMREILKSAGYRFHIETVTNQIFVILTPEEYEALGRVIKFGFWERLADGNVVVRFASSWATTEEDVAEFEKCIRDFAELRGEAND